MAGKGPSHRHPASSSHRKTRWESNNPPPDHISGDPKPSLPRDSPSAGPSKLTPSDPSPPSRPLSSGLPLPVPGAPMPEAGAMAAPPIYGFHMLERRTIVLADGTVRSYFALPPDSPAGHRNIPDFPPRDDKFAPSGPYGTATGHTDVGGLGLDRAGGMDRRFPARLSPEGFEERFRRDRDRDREGLLAPPERGEPFGRGGDGGYDYWNSREPENPLKRKYGEEARERDFMDDRDRFGGSSHFRSDEFSRQRQQLLQYGNPNGFPGARVGDRSDFMTGTSSPLDRSGPDSGRGTEDLPLSKHMKIGDGYDDMPSKRSGPSEVRENADGEGKRGTELSEATRDVNSQALRKAFLRFAKTLNENLAHRNAILEDGKSGTISCFVCGRAAKEFVDTHSLIMHAYNSQNADLRTDHLGLHKALCVMMGWNYDKAPENSKAYQSFSADEAAENKEDLILWPPVVIIHNTNSGRRKDGRMEGMGNKEMDSKLKDLGFTGGKSKSIFGKEGHMGVTVVKFANNPPGLKEAERLAEFFEKEGHGRKGWALAQASQVGDDDEKNPNLVKADEKTGEKKRIFYGYLGTASDLDKVDFDLKKRAVIKSRKDFDASD